MDRAELYYNDLCDVDVCDVEQNIRSAAPLARRECDSMNGGCTSSPAADRQLLTAANTAMFSSNLMTTPSQYEQFVRLQQLLMHMQTNGLLQLSENGAQVRNACNHWPAAVHCQV